MAEKMTGDIGCEDGCAAVRRKPWATPKVIMSEHASRANKVIFGSESHGTSPPTVLTGPS
jgi:hypothetical protein